MATEATAEIVETEATDVESVITEIQRESAIEASDEDHDPHTIDPLDGITK